MSRISTLLCIFVLATAPPLFGQSKPGHVYHVFFGKALPGQLPAYNQVYADAVRPVFDELVRRKAIVSYLDLVQHAGAGDYSHINIVEFPNWAALGNFNAQLDEASRSVLGKPWPEVLATFTNLREFLRFEIYISPVPSSGS